MSVSFGGTSAWKVQQVGDIVRAYHWVSDEPAMVLYPARQRSSEAGAYVICLSSAFKYDDIQYLVKQAAIAADVMGMDQTKQTIHRIGTAIHDGLLDLIKMPPEPQWIKDAEKGAVIAEMEVKKYGKTIMEREVHAGERGNVRG
jgi:hypothetical protein